MDSVLSLKGEDGLPGEDGRKVRGVVRIVDKMLPTKCSKFDVCVRPSVLCPVCRVTKEKQEQPEETSVKLVLFYTYLLSPSVLLFVFTFHLGSSCIDPASCTITALQFSFLNRLFSPLTPTPPPPIPIPSTTQGCRHLRPLALTSTLPPCSRSPPDQ